MIWGLAQMATERSTSESSHERQMRALLSEVDSTLYLLAKQDQRMGAKQFYRDSHFGNVINEYFIAANQASNKAGLTRKQINLLQKTASNFLEYVHHRYEKDRSRIITTLRAATGNSFTELYKNTRTLVRLCDVVLTDGTEVEPMNLPDQKPSPIYTKVERDRVVLDAGHALHPFLRKEGINETRRYLKAELTRIAETLKSSNVDRRYVEAFAKLVDLVNFKSDAGAISFGLHVRMISQLTKQIEQELSDVLNVQIASTLTHASYFASQYKDWMDFLYHAQSYPSGNALEDKIEEALASVTETLRNNTIAVDENIPRTIEFITGMLKGTGEDRKQAIYAGVRSVENFCISAIRYSYDQAVRLLQDSGTRARPKLVGIGAATIIAVAMGVIANFMPIIVNASELNWILENLHNIEKIGKILR
jgi:hypothetical protein